MKSLTMMRRASAVPLLHTAALASPSSLKVLGLACGCNSINVAKSVIAGRYLGVIHTCAIPKHNRSSMKKKKVQCA